MFLWNRCDFHGLPSHLLARRFKTLKEDLKTWKKCRSRDVGVNKRRLLNEILCMDEKEGQNGLTSKERN